MLTIINIKLSLGLGIRELRAELRPIERKAGGAFIGLLVAGIAAGLVGSGYSEKHPETSAIASQPELGVPRSTIFDESFEGSGSQSKVQLHNSEFRKGSRIRDFKIDMKSLGSNGFSGRTQKDLSHYVSKEAAAEMKIRYYDAVREYEMKENYGLITLSDRQAQADRMNSMADYYLRDLIDTQIEAQLNQVEENTDSGASVVKAARSIRSSAEILMHGKTEFSLTEGTKLGATTSIKTGSGNVFVNSRVINASVNAQIDADDKVSVSGSRNLIFGMKGNVSYGVRTKNLRTNVSRQIAPNVTAELGHVRTAQNSEEALQVRYGISF